MNSEKYRITEELIFTINQFHIK